MKSILVVGTTQVINGVKYTWKYDEHGNIIDFQSSDPSVTGPYDELKKKLDSPIEVTFNKDEGFNDVFSDFSEFKHSLTQNLRDVPLEPIIQCADIGSDIIHPNSEANEFVLKLLRMMFRRAPKIRRRRQRLKKRILSKKKRKLWYKQNWNV